MIKFARYRNILIGLWVFVLLYSNAIGIVEGKIFPVVSDFTVVSGLDNTVHGSFSKLRDCTFAGVDWFYTEADERIPAELTITENSVFRRSGNQIYGPWIVNITPDLVVSNSYILVNHDCHIFWNTVTRVYP
jgi:hypothetical protein